MLKVKWQQVTVRIPVIDDSGDHDAKISDSEYQAIRHYYEQLSMVGGHSAIIAGAPVSATQQNGWRSEDPKWGDQLRALKQCVEVSQVDPIINTAVTDSEMRRSERGEPEMTLEQLRERPERTRAAPRPRANSWRHNE